jgi:hypothetical protein
MRAQEAADSMETLQKDIDQLKGELQQQTTAITARWDDATKAFDEFPVRPAKNDIDVETVALAWTCLPRSTGQYSHRTRKSLLKNGDRSREAAEKESEDRCLVFL